MTQLFILMGDIGDLENEEPIAVYRSEEKARKEARRLEAEWKRTWPIFTEWANLRREIVERRKPKRRVRDLDEPILEGSQCTIRTFIEKFGAMPDEYFWTPDEACEQEIAETLGSSPKVVGHHYCNVFTTEDRTPD